MTILCNCQRGVSLIEVLITVLVISIGLLGLASLQLKSMSLSAASNQRQQAINLAHDISDRIFVNGAGASAGAYTVVLGAATVEPATNVATGDHVRWRAIADLFRADYQIGDTSGAIKDYTITICWRDKNVTIPNALCNNQAERDAFEMQATRR
jgi:type IV pilus assembly protein PilV